jgi:hypothetical protein
MVSLYRAWIYFMFVHGYTDANSGDQNSSTRSRINRENRLSLTMGTGVIKLRILPSQIPVE